MKKEFSNESEWLEARKDLITSTIASAILGKNPYLTSLEAWEILIGKSNHEDVSNKPYVVYGKKAEKYIRELFFLNHDEYTNIENKKENEYCLYVSDEEPFIAASGDGIYMINETNELESLEIKTSEILASMQKENWKERIPDNYYIQVLIEMYCQKTKGATLVAELKYSKDYIARKEYHITRNEEVENDIQYVVSKLKDFYNNYVITKKRPPLILDF